MGLIVYWPDGWLAGRFEKSLSDQPANHSAIHRIEVFQHVPFQHPFLLLQVAER
jgi:hypothetical protein